MAAFSRGRVPRPEISLPHCRPPSCTLSGSSGVGRSKSRTTLESQLQPLRNHQEAGPAVGLRGSRGFGMYAPNCQGSFATMGKPRSGIHSRARPSARRRIEAGQHLAAARPGRTRALENPRLWFDSRVVVQRPHRNDDHIRPRNRTRYPSTTFAAERIREPLRFGHLVMVHQRLAGVPGQRAGDEQVGRMARTGRLAAPRTVAVPGALRVT
jgi:hypothetical protein